jgi:hypothetical protein
MHPFQFKGIKIKTSDLGGSRITFPNYQKSQLVMSKILSFIVRQNTIINTSFTSHVQMGLLEVQFYYMFRLAVQLYF